MKYQGMLAGLGIILGLTACSERIRPAAIFQPQINSGAGCSRVAGLSDDERVLTILGTNDIHGTVEPKLVGAEQRTVGGMGFFTGLVQSVREGVQAKYGDDCGGVVLVDGGDQFQGTLLSNYDEGQLMFNLMNTAKYDAVVPGNHDYDFGPIGWLEDQLSERTPGGTRRGALERLAAMAKFQLVSANTYLRDSLKDFTDGSTVPVSQKGCAAPADRLIDWKKAVRLSLFAPYKIVERAGVRIALVGLDNDETGSDTTQANVSDLCFRDPFAEYMEIRQELEGKADVFVIVMHQGDINSEFHMTDLLKKILAANPRGVDAIVGGHTHQINNVNVDGVPGIQSGAYGGYFGRVELVYNTRTKQVDRQKMKFRGGISIEHSKCDEASLTAGKFEETCAVATRGAATEISFDSKPVVANAESLALVSDAKKNVAHLADRFLGTTRKKLYRDRILESPLANIFNDALLAATGADISAINTGGIRQDIQPGKVTYETLYGVLPFGNRAVVLAPMKTETLLKLITRSVLTCGNYGSLMFGGIRVTYSRDCANAVNGIDPKAKLLTVTLSNGADAGTVIYDATGAEAPVVLDRTFKIATLDFLATGGSGFTDFASVPIVQDLGIFREVLTDTLIATPGNWDSELDGRWKNVFVAPTPSP